MGEVPETRYVTGDDGIHLAYQVVGTGRIDLVVASGIQSHLDLMWGQPVWARFLTRLASFARLILFDRRGVGLSDRRGELPTLELQMDDVGTVMDAAASKRAALLGIDDGGLMCLLFAAAHPERTAALVTYGSTARVARGDDYPLGYADADFGRISNFFLHQYGTGIDTAVVAPSEASNETFRQWWAGFQRCAGSPGDGLSMLKLFREADLRPVLPSISVPTLVLHRSGDRFLEVGHSRYLAEHIPEARYVELSGEDHLPWLGDSDALVDEIQTFLTGERAHVDLDRVLATVLFTDIVDSTAHAARLGDRQWAQLLDQHDQIIQQELDRHRGRRVNPTGDGVLATFDGPARAVRCAQSICQRSSNLDIEVRAGVHTGEVELRGDDIAGMAVHIGARVAALANANEILASRTVKDLVVGSGITFDHRGEHKLKGVPDAWDLFVVTSA